MGYISGGQLTLSKYSDIAGALTIQGFGDSITAIGAYQPTVIPSAYNLAPQWLPNTVYATNNVTVNNGLYYRCTAGGTSAGSGGPTGTSTAITDGTVTWRYMPPLSYKSCRNYLFWAEAFGLGAVRWNLDGYAALQNSLAKVIIANGGNNYSASDTVSFNNGATGTLTVVNGVITTVNITNPGYSSSGSAFSATITTSTGSGAVLCPVGQVNGSFGMPGQQTAACVAALPDVLASSADAIVVMIGTNDIANGATYAAITANIKTIYDTLQANGKKVIAIPILPRDSSLTTSIQIATQMQVNRWIRAYCRKESWANKQGFTNIVLADPTEFWTDSSSTTNSPIGGAAAGAGAMTVDGVHPSPRGAMYIAAAINDAIAPWAAVAPALASGIGMADGYDPTYNPSGNATEGLPWNANTNYALGAHASNDTAPVKVYGCITAGQSAASGGPTGTGSNITDGTAHWKFLYSQGGSVFAQTFDVTPTAATGIVYTGNAPHNMKLQRNSGTASGTVTITQESPWSNGQVGQRYSLAFSLGSGGNTEMWETYINAFGMSQYGIETSALANNYFYIEAEVNLSNVSNLAQISLSFTDNQTNAGTFSMDAGRDLAQGSGANYGMMNSSGEMISYPNNGTILLRSEPMQFPSNIGSVIFVLWAIFNASGGAGSATATIKINKWALRKAYL